MLEQIGDGLWTAFHPLKVGGLVALGTRMTVARLRDGGLLLSSPIPLNEPLRTEIDALGEVRVLACPNKQHHLFIGEWMNAYPNALSIAPAGLSAKRKDLAFKAEWSDTEVAEFAGAMEHLLVQGSPYLSEVVFLHKPSRTLILTDFALNFVRKEGDPLAMRVYYRLTSAGNGLGQNAVVRSVIKDKNAARASRDRMLAWDFDKIVVAHGDIVRERGHALLKAATAWLG